MGGSARYGAVRGESENNLSPDVLAILDSAGASVAFCAVLAASLGYTWRAYRQPYLGHWAVFWALYVVVWSLDAVFQLYRPTGAPAGALHLVMVGCSFTARTLLAVGTLRYLGRPAPSRGTVRLIAAAIACFAVLLAATNALAEAGVLPRWAPIPLRTYFIGVFLHAAVVVALVRAARRSTAFPYRLLLVAICTAGLSDAWDVVLDVFVESPWTATGTVLRLSNFVAHLCDILFAAGMLIAALGTERERTERIAASLRDREARMQEALRLETLGRLAGGLAHDFNNLLTAVLAHLAFIRDELPTDSSLREDVDAASGAAERGARLTRQLLTLTRRQPTESRLLDLNEVLQGLDRMAVPLLGERITRVLALSPGPWPVSADRTQVEQLVLNLLVNARDAMPDGGTVRIETANVSVRANEPLPEGGALAPGDWVRLAVEDDGHGMDEETRSRVFEPFFTTKPRERGSGLGLATVQAIAAQAGGAVFVRSAPGAGARFAVYLPRREGRLGDAPAAAGAPEARPGSETLLVVEDQPELRALAVRALERSGYTVLAAADGAAALRLTADQLAGVALVVTDVVMPGMDGRELAGALRARRPDLPVLFMSGYAPAALDAQGRGGPTPLLQKPFTPDQLVARVQQELDPVAAASRRGAA